jgi:hypothetical protein
VASLEIIRSSANRIWDGDRSIVLALLCFVPAIQRIGENCRSRLPGAWQRQVIAVEQPGQGMGVGATGDIDGDQLQ